MQYCKSCGKELADEAIICTGCGCATDGFYSKPNKVSVQNTGELSLMALLGFIFSFLSCLVGLILSCIAYKTAVNENDEKSKNFAKAGIIISAVFIALAIVVTVVYGVYVALYVSVYGPGRI
ncbi:MAG: hypothetical protein K2H30_02970 [Clostridia bacterium]|nr:hypothetical protein [Clostridia bacterium]